MPIYPGAVWRPVGWANARDDNTDATVVILHVTATNAASQYNYFLTSQKACSHFHVALDGEVEQYIDTSKLSAADYEGSDNAISIETAGLGDGSWTPAQMVSIAKLLAWIHAQPQHPIPLKLKDTSSSSPGIAWHRLGITGNFPSLPSLLAGRNQRGYAGEAWSLSGGKVCPGDKRIVQIPALVAAAGGASIDTEVFLMALSDEKQDELYAKVGEIRTITDQTRTKVARLETDEAARRDADLAHMAASAARELQLQTSVTALSAAVAALAESSGVDPAVIVSTVDAAVNEALSDLRITLSTEEA